VTHRFSRLTGQLGLRTRLHDLRRYAATQLIAGGWMYAPSRVGSATLAALQRR
jgi:hypothetical protein